MNARFRTMSAALLLSFAGSTMAIVAPAANADVDRCGQQLRAKNISCSKARDIVDRGQRKWRNRDREWQELFRVGKYRCEVPTYSDTPIYCHHRETPKKKWAIQQGGE